MFALKIYHFILGLVPFIQDSSAERRITGGAAVKDNSSTGYVVYLRESRSYETRSYKAPWICGGAIVTASHILTSAACVKNVEYLLAVAGTRKFEDYETFEKCMNHMYVKRIVSICVPKKYKFNYTVENWIDNDIAVVEVETPYFFNYYRPDNNNCYQYSPRPIEVNYDPVNEKRGTDAVVFGWGHKLKYGTKSEIDDNGMLNYAPVLVIDKEKCKNYYLNTPNLLPIIDKEKICTLGSGNLNYEGRMYDKDLDEINPHPELLENCRKNSNPETTDERNVTTYNENADENGKISVQNSTNATISSRRNHPSKDNIDFKNLNIGICQNDHGGPLIRWSNRRELLIGLASVFMNGDDDTCVGPFLYTSTASHRKFIECVTNYTVNPKFFRKSCDDLNESGIGIYRRQISWDKQLVPIPELKPRPQVPINQFHFEAAETH